MTNNRAASEHQEMEKKSRFILIVVVVLALAGYGIFTGRIPGIAINRVLPDIQKKGKLVVIIRNAPTVYYEGPEGPMGFEYELIDNFANHLNVKLEIKILHSISDILNAMKTGKADIAAAAITRTEEREDLFLFGPDYYTVQQQVVRHRGAKKIVSVEDLIGLRGVVIANSSYHEQLTKIQKEFPALNWETANEMNTEQLCEMVAEKKIDFTIADSNILAVNQRYLPTLIQSFSISENQSLAWVLRKDGKDLKREIEDWLETYIKEKKLSHLHDKYYGHIDQFDFVETATFHKHIKNRLPKYQKLFQKSSETYHLPWTLLAAQAYQESHWNPYAKSPTGVRGIMMLTQNTAKSLGVKNRIDPVASIRGGAKYLSKLIKRLPETIDDDNKIWFALAAYNVGMVHIHDAQKLAEKQNKNKNLWQDIKTVLPLLSQKKYYKKLKYGYARGSEPVKYVENIINYRDILENHFNTKD